MCYNCEHSSVILQGVLDNKSHFTDIYVGWPSRIHDARVLKNTQTYIYAREESGCLFPSNCIQLQMNVSIADVPELVGPVLYIAQHMSGTWRGI